MIYVYRLIKSIKKDNLINTLKSYAEKNNFSFKIISSLNQVSNISSKDILVTWNNHIGQHLLIEHFQKHGAKVVSFENPYIQMLDDWYSVGFGWHNNTDFAPKKLDRDRWKKYFGHVDLKPWKNIDGYYLVATQAKTFNGEGLGHEQTRQPNGWDLEICSQLKSSGYDVVFRRHPRTRDTNLSKYPKWLSVSNQSLFDDLQNTKATVVYSSNTATESLIEGVPVIYCGKNIFLKDACSPSINKLNYYNDRLSLFEHMAWAQYSIEEIASGYMFDILLNSQ